MGEGRRGAWRARRPGGDQSCWCGGCLQPPPGSGLAPKPGSLLAPKWPAGPLASLEWLFSVLRVSCFFPSDLVCVPLSVSLLPRLGGPSGVSLGAPFAFFHISASVSRFALPPSWLSSCLRGPTAYRPLRWALGHGAEEGSALEGRGSWPRSLTRRRRPLSGPWGEGPICMTAGVGGFSRSSMLEELRLEGELRDAQARSTCQCRGGRG